jgi:hypothetical protein
MAAAGEGCLDNWSEFFSWDRWERALEKTGIDPAWYVERERPKEETLPWDHLSCGVGRDFLWEEYLKAMKGESTPDCRRDGCYECGACSSALVDVCLAKGGPE